MGLSFVNAFVNKPGASSVEHANPFAKLIFCQNDDDFEGNYLITVLEKKQF